jgi:hypothetical protein
MNFTHLKTISEKALGLIFSLHEHSGRERFGLRRDGSSRASARDDRALSSVGAAEITRKWAWDAGEGVSSSRCIFNGCYSEKFSLYTYIEAAAARGDGHINDSVPAATSLTVLLNCPRA